MLNLQNKFIDFFVPRCLPAVVGRVGVAGGGKWTL
jgi:hypothetical protein